MEDMANIDNKIIMQFEVQYGIISKIKSTNRLVPIVKLNLT